MLVTRQTRSGAVFSPWELSAVYHSPVAISALAAQDYDPAEQALEIDGGPVDVDPSLDSAAHKSTPSFPSDAVTGRIVLRDVPVDEVLDAYVHEAGCFNPQVLEGGANQQYASEATVSYRFLGNGPAADADVSGMGKECSGSGSQRLERKCVPSSSEIKDSSDEVLQTSRKQRNKARTNAHKHAKRRDVRMKQQEGAASSLKQISRRRVAESQLVSLQSVDASQLPHTPRGYVGLTKRTPEVRKMVETQTRVNTLAELLEMGFQYVPFSGLEGIGILDCESRLVVGGGMPRGEDWQDCTKRCAELIESIRGECKFNTNHLVHSRGPFPAMAHGISYGLGQPRPMAHAHSAANARAFDILITDADMRRIAGFQSQLLTAFAPELAEEYKIVLNGILDQQPELHRNFTNSDYATITVNFGPYTVSTPHVDVADLAYGLCAITALGTFDADLGGHLVLWDLRMVVRFPPGSTLLVPSAVVRHSNLPIQPHEKRYSVTQYSAGPLFRWFNNGYRSDKEVFAQEGTDEHLAPQWEAGLSKLQSQFVRLLSNRGARVRVFHTLFSALEAYWHFCQDNHPDEQHFDDETLRGPIFNFSLSPPSSPDSGSSSDSDSDDNDSTDAPSSGFDPETFGGTAVEVVQHVAFVLPDGTHAEQDDNLSNSGDSDALVPEDMDDMLTVWDDGLPRDYWLVRMEAGHSILFRKHFQALDFYNDFFSMTGRGDLIQSNGVVESPDPIVRDFVDGMLYFAVRTFPHTRRGLYSDR
ncbi:hypothetical protein ONZ45_g10816 [Pleurotus djamor]|nr:hypothetical protein ONZ45_g10816 [Pleurotus djamor]